MSPPHLPPREALTDLCHSWRVTELALFGSTARGDSRPDSDVDLLVTFEESAPWSTLDLVDMRDEFTRLFGRPVDLIEERTVRNPYRRASMLRDKSVLYAA